jgi:hypothetical protein
MEAISNWRKSTRSNYNGECVEAGNSDEGVAVRDTADRDGAMLVLNRDAWRELVRRLKVQKSTI